MVIELVAADPPAPLLDHAGVEAARLIRRERERLVTESAAVTVAMLADARGVDENTARQWMQRHRRAGRLVTVDHFGTVLIPSFQFDEAYDLSPHVAEVVAVLTDSGMSGWAIWRWFCTENPWLERRPVDAIEAGDADTVLSVARRLVADDGERAG